MCVFIIASIACWADSIRGGNVTTVEGQIANLMLVRTGEADTLEKECFTIQTLDETATSEDLCIMVLL